MQWVQFHESLKENKLISIISPLWHMEAHLSQPNLPSQLVMSQPILAVVRASVQQDVAYLLSRGLYCKIGLYFSVWSF